MNKLLTIINICITSTQWSYKAKKVLKWCTCLSRLGLFLLICKASLSLRSMELLAVSRIIKQESVYKLLQEGDSGKCLKICDFLSLIECSLILVEKWGLVSPI